MLVVYSVQVIFFLDMENVHPTTQNALPRANRVTRGDLFTSFYLPLHVYIKTYNAYIN